MLTLPNALAHFASNSRVARESLTHEMQEKTVFKGLEMSVFKYLQILHSIVILQYYEEAYRIKNMQEIKPLLLENFGFCLF